MRAFSDGEFKIKIRLKHRFVSHTRDSHFRPLTSAWPHLPTTSRAPTDPGFFWNLFTCSTEWHGAPGQNQECTCDTIFEIIKHALSSVTQVPVPVPVPVPSYNSAEKPHPQGRLLAIPDQVRGPQALCPFPLGHLCWQALPCDFTGICPPNGLCVSSATAGLVSDFHSPFHLCLANNSPK